MKNYDETFINNGFLVILAAHSISRYRNLKVQHVYKVQSTIYEDFGTWDKLFYLFFRGKAIFIFCFLASSLLFCSHFLVLNEQQKAREAPGRFKFE